MSKPEDNGKCAKQPEDDDQEVMIAADFTLYSNPLKCLSGYGKEISRKCVELTKNCKDSGNDMIAADLTKYGSPLDDDRDK